MSTPARRDCPAASQPCLYLCTWYASSIKVPRVGWSFCELTKTRSAAESSRLLPPPAFLRAK